MAVIPTQLCSVVVKGLKLKLSLHLIYILIVLIQSIQDKITQKVLLSQNLSMTVPYQNMLSVWWKCILTFMSNLWQN